MAFVAESKRNKFWFGTENYMNWFPTPLRGADVSSSGWSATNDLLNGGGHQLNSFGSHKNYIFEWSGTSSRQVAQLMKSYADGTYGRGLIYFVDPLTFDTNVLPAMWADPSMGVGQEGATLVYGVDPLPSPTSNWQVNELPVTSAFYNLSSVTPGWRGKEDAVFIPVPEGYSLALGAFYQFSGSGGVFYRTQSRSGALGAVSSVTPLLNNAGEVVNTLVSGSDIAGVWMFVGRSSSVTSSVTLTAMIARLIETSKTTSQLVATNLFTNPRLVGDGTWAEVARWDTGDEPPVMAQPEDFRVRDLGTGESVMEIERVAGLTATNCVAGVSTKAGKPAVRLIPSSVSNGSLAILILPAGVPAEGVALGTLHLDAPLEEPLFSPGALSVYATPPNQFVSAPNAPGVYPLRLSFSGLPSHGLVSLIHGGAQGSGDVWWTDIGLFEGNYTGPAFNGDSGFIRIGNRQVRTQWDGPEDTSTSSAWTVTPDYDKLRKGPWIGGQGHSGCRFVGKPTYIENTGVNGGQVGFAASFREVGSWLYG